MDVTLNELGKFILYVGLTVSVVGVSTYLMRFISVVSKSVGDLRKTIKNIGIITDGFVEDQKLIKEGLKKFVSIGDKLKKLVDEFNESVIGPIRSIAGMLAGVMAFSKGFMGKFKKDKDV